MRFLLCAEIFDKVDPLVPFVSAGIIALILSTIGADLGLWWQETQAKGAAESSAVRGERLVDPIGHGASPGEYRE